KDMLAALGMQKGERIESKMVTRQIESSQKKVEERHFEQRKHLLEYDEVMDEQRRRIYNYRQRILENADCRKLLLEMIDKQLVHWTKEFLKPDYRWETILEWIRQNCSLEQLEIRHIRNYLEADDLIDYLKNQCDRDAEVQIKEKIEENLPADVEDDRERNWQAMSMWANRRYGMNTNDRELRKIGLENLQENLYSRALESIARFDFTPIKHFMDSDWGLRALSSWVHQQYRIDIPFESFRGKSADESAEIIKNKIEELYRHKEIEFPVTVGMSMYMAESSTGGGERYNREGLASWAADRFDTPLASDSFNSKSRDDIARQLLDLSTQYLQRGAVIQKLPPLLDAACGPARPTQHLTNGHAKKGS
ncbi:MAG: preprotein translocase subunit SecA, partial [Planctomycetes bacterium]|nr:preprotein translocase subunit SecA [Planctomycetota bacterium]